MQPKLTKKYRHRTKKNVLVSILFFSVMGYEKVILSFVLNISVNRWTPIIALESIIPKNTNGG
jgi:hypothetical protein